VRPLQCAPPPPSGDLNSHTELLTCRSPHMTVMRVIVLHPYNKSEVRRPSVMKTWLTFWWPWPLTSKCGHGSPVSRASFPPIFSFLCPSVLQLVSCTGQTDRQTDNRHQRAMPPPYGGGVSDLITECTTPRTPLKLTRARHLLEADPGFEPSHSPLARSGQP